MSEPILFGLRLSEAFFYFMVYSCLGWMLETTYCSIVERHFAFRGFLYGPICPIYGVGALMMICWFRPFLDRPVLFYLVATVCMSAWEYLVGWFLEVTTHIKYWDYSMHKFNIKGRICLWVCLTWGVLSFIILYFVHPRIARVAESIPALWRYVLDGVLFVVLCVDAAATIYQLAKTSQLMDKLQTAGDELRLQVHLGRAELSDRLNAAKAEASARLDDLLPDDLDEQGRLLKARYDELMNRTEHLSRRFRSTYKHMSVASGKNKERREDMLESVRRRGEQIKARREELRRSRRGGS